jgi:Ca2+/H+ antiporter
MQALDSVIAYYLCAIMLVLGLIIAVGAVRQHTANKRR